MQPTIAATVPAATEPVPSPSANTEGEPYTHANAQDDPAANAVFRCCSGHGGLELGAQ